MYACILRIVIQNITIIHMHRKVTTKDFATAATYPHPRHLLGLFLVQKKNNGHTKGGLFVNHVRVAIGTRR